MDLNEIHNFKVILTFFLVLFFYRLFLLTGVIQETYDQLDMVLGMGQKKAQKQGRDERIEEN